MPIDRYRSSEDEGFIESCNIVDAMMRAAIDAVLAHPTVAQMPPDRLRMINLTVMIGLVAESMAEIVGTEDGAEMMLEHNIKNMANNLALAARAALADERKAIGMTPEANAPEPRRN